MNRLSDVDWARIRRARAVIAEARELDLTRLTPEAVAVLARVEAVVEQLLMSLTGEVEVTEPLPAVVEISGESGAGGGEA